MGTVTKRSTPCVGICSTTYGDLVCRGCKRFAHEIVKWNGFSGDQRAVVWDRLYELRQGAVGQWLRVCDFEALLARAEYCNVPDRDELGPLNLAYEVLRTTQMPLSELPRIGIDAQMQHPHPKVHDPQRASETGQWSRDLVRLIDQEFYARSLAHYERNFKIAAQ